MNPKFPEMSGVKFKNKHEDPVWNELNEEVYAWFSRNNISVKANTFMYVKAAFYLVTTVILYTSIVFLQLPTGVLLFLVILLGVSIAGVGFNVSHDALHSAFSFKKKVNNLLGYSMDLMGSNGYLWKLNHNIHHSNTNIHGLDGDIKDSAFLRLCPYAPYRRLHRYQVFTALIIYSSFYLLIVYLFNFLNILGKNFGNHENRSHSPKQVLFFILQKLLYLFIWVFVPLFFMNRSPGEFIAGYLLLSAVTGIFISLFFFLAHNVEAVGFAEQERITGPISWAEHQLRTTSNFRSGKLFSLFLGGMNYQVEHHLFPGICSIHYPRISLIVQRVAQHHGIPYHVQESVFQSVKSHFKFLYKLSFPDNGRSQSIQERISG